MSSIGFGGGLSVTNLLKPLEAPKASDNMQSILQKEQEKLEELQRDSTTNTILTSRSSSVRNSASSTAESQALFHTAKQDLTDIMDLLQEQENIAKMLTDQNLTANERAFLTQSFENNSESIESIATQKNFQPSSNTSNTVAIDKTAYAAPAGTQGIAIATTTQATTSSFSLESPNSNSKLDAPEFDILSNIGEGQALDENAISIVNSVDSTGEGTKGKADLVFSNNNFEKGDTISLNGVDITAGGEGESGFEIGETLSETIDNIVNTLNSHSDNRLQEATYSRTGNNELTIDLNDSGTNNDFSIEFNIANDTTEAKITTLDSEGNITTQPTQEIDGEGKTIEEIGTAGVDEQILVEGKEGEMSLRFTNNNISEGDSVTINNVKMIAGGEGENSFEIGETLADTLDNLANALNNHSDAAIQEATYTSNGTDTLNIKLDNTGTANNDFNIDFDIKPETTEAKISIVDAEGNETQISTDELTGTNNTIATLGTAGEESKIEGATKGELSLDFSGGKLKRNEEFNFNGLELTSGKDFKIGRNTKQTLDNMVEALNKSDHAGAQEATYSREGNSLKITLKEEGVNNDYSVGFELDHKRNKTQIALSDAQGNQTQAATNSLSNATIQDFGTAGDAGTEIAATQGQATLKLDSNQITEGASITLNGTTFTAGAEGENGFEIGATLSETIDNLANALNNSSDTNIQEATYSRVGEDSLEIKLDNAGPENNDFSIEFDFKDVESVKSKVEVLDGQGNVTHEAASELLDNTIADLGSIGNSGTPVEATQSNAQLRVDSAQISEGTEITLNGVTLTAGGEGENSFEIGETLSDTLDNLANTLNSSTDARLQEATYTQTGGNTLDITIDNGGTENSDFSIEFKSDNTEFSVLDSQGNASVESETSLSRDTKNIGSIGTAGEDTIEIAGTQAKAQLKVESEQISEGTEITLNGETLTAGEDFEIGATLSETIDNLAQTLNNSTSNALSQATYEKVGDDTLSITVDQAGTAGNDFELEFNSEDTKFSIQDAEGNETIAATNSFGTPADTIATIGTTGDAGTLVEATQGKAAITLSNNNISDGDTLEINGVTLTAGGEGESSFQVGETLDATIDNIAKALNAHSDEGVQEASYSRSGNDTLEIELKEGGSANNDFSLGFDIKSETTNTKITVQDAAGNETLVDSNELTGTNNTITSLGTAGTDEFTEEGTKGQMSLDFNNENMQKNDDIKINGKRFRSGKDFKIGENMNETLTNLTNALNSSTNKRVQEASYSLEGNSIKITMKEASSATNDFDVDFNLNHKRNKTTIAISDGQGNQTLAATTKHKDATIAKNGTAGTDDIKHEATQGSAQLKLDSNEISQGATITLNGTTFTAGGEGENSFEIGETLGQTVDNLAKALNNSSDTNIQEATYTSNGDNILTIELDEAGTANNDFSIAFDFKDVEDVKAKATISDGNGNVTSEQSANLTGATIESLGTAGTDERIEGATQGSVNLRVDSENIEEGTEITVNGVIVTAGGEGENDFAVGATLSETLDNLASALNDSSNTRLQEATFSNVGGDTLNITLDNTGAANDDFSLEFESDNTKMSVLNAEGKETVSSTNVLGNEADTLETVGTEGTDAKTIEATQGSAQLQFDSENISEGTEINLNGVTLTAGGEGENSFEIGATLSETIDNLANTLNNSSNANLQEATYEKSGDNALKITLDQAGTSDNDFELGFKSDDTKMSVLDGEGKVSIESTNSLDNEVPTIESLGTQGVDAHMEGATTGGVNLTFTNNNIKDGDTLTINGTTLTAGAEGENGFEVGATLSETIDNIASTLNNSTDSDVQEATYSRKDNDTLSIDLKETGNTNSDFDFEFNIATETTEAKISITDAAGNETQVSTDLLEGTNNTIATLGTAGTEDVVEVEATQGQISLDFDGDRVRNNETFNFNGLELTSGKDFKTSRNLSKTLDNLVDALNNSTHAGAQEATYSREGDSIKVTLKDEGASNNDFEIGFELDHKRNKAAISISDGQGNQTHEATNSVSGLTIESNGTAGVDEIITEGTKGQATLTLDSNKITNGASITLNGETFTAGAEGENGFAIGETLSETLDNLVSALNNSTNANIQEATYTKVGDDSLSITLKDNGQNNDYSIEFDFNEIENAKAQIEISDKEGNVTREAASSLIDNTIDDLGTDGINEEKIDATKGQAILKLDSNEIEIGAEITLNGVTLTADGSGEHGFEVGETLAETLQNLADTLNNSSDERLQEATYEAGDDTLTITLKEAGSTDNDYTIDFDFTKESAKTQISIEDANNEVTLENTFESTGETISTVGSVGVGAELNAGSQGVAQLQFTDNNIATGSTIELNGVTLEANGTGPNSFEVGETLEETLDNLATALNASTDSNLQEATYTRNGSDTLKIELNKTGADNDFSIGFNLGNASNESSAQISVLDQKGNTTLEATNSLDGTTGSIETLGTAGLEAKALSDSESTFDANLLGTLTDIKASFTEGKSNTNGNFSKNTITLTATINNETYTSNAIELQGGNINGTGTGDNGLGSRIDANTVITFTKDNGLDSDLSIALTTGDSALNVNNSADADALAQEFQQLLSNTSIRQEKELTSLDIVGSQNTVLNGIQPNDVTLTSDNFSDENTIQSFSFDDTTKTLQAEINGEKFTAQLSDSNSFSGTYDASTETIKTDGVIKFTNAAGNAQLEISLENVLADEISLKGEENQNKFTDGLNDVFNTELKIIPGRPGSTTGSIAPTTDHSGAGVLVNKASLSNLLSQDASSRLLNSRANSSDDANHSIVFLETAMNNVNSLIGEMDEIINANKASVEESINTLKQLEEKRADFIMAEAEMKVQKQVEEVIKMQAKLAVPIQTNQINSQILELVFNNNR